MSKKLVTLVVPTKEEIPHIINLLKSIVKSRYVKEIIVVLEVNVPNKFFKHKKVKLINQKNKGYGAAIKEGFKKSKSKYTCIYNADGSFDLNDLKKMIKLTKRYDFIFASRYLRGGGSEDDTCLTIVGNFLFTKLGLIFLNIKLSDILYTYVLCNTNLFKKFNFSNDDFRFCIELPNNVVISNYKYTSFPSCEYKRKYGKKNVNEFRDGFLILTEIIKCFIKKLMKI